LVDEQFSLRPLSNPDLFIKSVLPEEMAGHFLFDGEYAENFVSEDNKGQIREAVRDILGCQLLEMAISDLGEVSKEYRSNMSKLEKSPELSRLREQIDSGQEKIEEYNRQLQHSVEKRASIEKQVQDIDTRLTKIPDTKELQKYRLKLEDDLKRGKIEKQNAELEVYSWIGDNSRYLVSDKVAMDVVSYLDIQCDHGRIPAPYNEHFVNSLLSSNRCICGRSLDAESNEYQLVTQLLQTAGNKFLMDRVIKIKSQVSSLKQRKQDAPSKLQIANQRLAKSNSDLDYIENELGVVGKKLAGINFEEVGGLEFRRQNLRNELGKLNQDIGSLKSNIERIQDEVNTDQSKHDNLSRQFAQLQPIRAKKKLCDDLLKIFTEHLKHEEEKARRQLEHMIAQIIDKTSRKNFVVELDRDFALYLKSNDDVKREMPKSSGENQLLSLAFTAALVNYAKVREDSNSADLLKGTIAPLVLDSPFGQLDLVYRVATAEFIPAMARQVVLLLSRSQGDKSVLDALYPHVGKEYVLVRHNTGVRNEGQQLETREIHGKTICLTQYDSHFNGTELIEVTSV
jgi:DNA sulfur modification protein DndD